MGGGTIRSGQSPNFDGNGNLIISSGPPVAKGNISGADGVAVTVATPIVIDVNDVYSTNGSEFIVKNTGLGDITVAHSDDGVSFGSEVLVIPNDIFNSGIISIDSFRVTALLQNGEFSWIAKP